MKGNNEDSFVYSGPISSARRTKIYVNFAHQTHNLCAIKNIIKACQKLQFVNKYTLGTFLNFFGWKCLFVCLIWFFTSQSTRFQLCWDCSSWVEPVVSKYWCVLVKHITQWRRWEYTRELLGIESSIVRQATVHPPWNAWGRSSPSVALKRLAVSNWQNINNYVHVARKCLRSAWIVTVW